MLSKNCNRLLASSLIETLVALAICAACLATAILIFVKVLEKSKSIALVKVEQELTKKTFNDWLEGTVPETGKETYDGFTITRFQEKSDFDSQSVIINYSADFRNTRIERKIIFDTEK